MKVFEKLRAWWRSFDPKCELHPDAEYSYDWGCPACLGEQIRERVARGREIARLEAAKERAARVREIADGTYEALQRASKDKGLVAIQANLDSRELRFRTLTVIDRLLLWEASMGGIKSACWDELRKLHNDLLYHELRPDDQGEQSNPEKKEV